MTGENPLNYTLGVPQCGNPERAGGGVRHGFSDPNWVVHGGFVDFLMAKGPPTPASCDSCGAVARSDIQRVQHGGAFGSIPNFIKMLLQRDRVYAIAASGAPLRAFRVGQEKIAAHII